jgi:EmrB/QacA subfamily drug resistance transporter
MQTTDRPSPRTGVRPPEPARAGWALALTSLSFFMVALDALVVITALPAIRAGLGGSLSTLEWTVNAYTLTFAAGIITAAALGDRLGRRRMYVAGLLLFTVASAACAVAPSAAALIAARAVQGVGAAFVTPLSLTILTAAFPANRRGAVMGIWGGLGGLAIACGPLVGGAVVEGLNWHWIFWVNVPIGLATAAASRFRLAESRGPGTRLDLPGMVLAATAATAVAWGLVRAADVGWGSLQVIGSLALGAALTVGLMAWERRAVAPMLPPGLLRIREFAAANLTGFCSFAAITSAAFLMSQYLQLGLGYSPLATGLRFLPWTATPTLIAPLAGVLADRIGTRPLMSAGLALQAAGLAYIAVVATTSTAYGQLVLPLVVAGVGISMALPSTPTAALGAVAPPDMGKASGVLNTLQRFGGVFGVAVVSAVFAGSGALTSQVNIVSGFRPALAVSAGLSLLGAASALWVRGRGSVPSLTQRPEPVPVPAGR